MSATSFGYNVSSVTPSPASLTLTIDFSGATMSATISNIPSDINFTLTPTGGFGQEILSQILLPIIVIVEPKLVSEVTGLNGKKYDIATIPSISVEGIDITPVDIVISSFSVGQTAMLEVTCSLTVTPAS